MASQTSQTQINENESVFSAGWQDPGDYQKDFADDGFLSQYRKIKAHYENNDIPQSSKDIEWLAKSGFLSAASYANAGQTNTLMQGGNVFEVSNLDDTGVTETSGTSIKDPYLLFKFGFYGSVLYRQIRSVIAAAIEN